MWLAHHCEPVAVTMSPGRSPTGLTSNTRRTSLVATNTLSRQSFGLHPTAWQHLVMSSRKLCLQHPIVQAPMTPTPRRAAPQARHTAHATRPWLADTHHLTAACYHEHPATVPASITPRRASSSPLCYPWYHAPVARSHPDAPHAVLLPPRRVHSLDHYVVVLLVQCGISKCRM